MHGRTFCWRWTSAMKRPSGAEWVSCCICSACKSPAGVVSWCGFAGGVVGWCLWLVLVSGVGWLVLVAAAAGGWSVWVLYCRLLVLLVAGVARCWWCGYLLWWCWWLVLLAAVGWCCLLLVAGGACCLWCWLLVVVVTCCGLVLVVVFGLLAGRLAGGLAVGGGAVCFVGCWRWW